MKNTIITQAIALGFDFSQFDSDATIEDIMQSLKDFFNENSEKLERMEDECEVRSSGRTQHVSYGDFWSDGEIVDFSSNWHKAPETKVFHSDFVMEDNGVMKCMKLYYLVGETDYNTPDRFYFDKKSNSHQPFTYDIVFNNDERTDNKGFALTLNEAKEYIRANNGTNTTYFADYKGGTVSAVCNQDRSTDFETAVI